MCLEKHFFLNVGQASPKIHLIYFINKNYPGKKIAYFIRRFNVWLT